MSRRPEADLNSPLAQPFFLEGGDHGVLLIHGFTGTAGHMRLIGEELHAHGFTVMGINLPGHGSTPEDMGRTDWQDWFAASREALAALRRRCTRVSCAGLSMGGVITLLLAGLGGVDSAATISAPMGVQRMPISLAWAAALVKPTIWWRENEERRMRLDPDYDLGYSRFPTRCASDLNHLIHLARRRLQAVACPLLAIQSRADETVSPDSADIILRGVSSRRKGVLWLEDEPHVCTISQAYPQIAEALMVHFLTENQSD